MAFEKDIEEAMDKLSAIDKTAVPRATSMAINRVAAKVMNRSIASTAEAVEVPKRLIKGRVKLEKAKPKRLAAFIKVNRSNLPLIRVLAGKSNIFVKRGKNKGQLKVGQRFYERAFIQKLSNGRVHVMQRQGKERYPIDVVKIPLRKPFTEVFEQEIAKAYKSDISKELKSTLDYQIKSVIK